MATTKKTTTKKTATKVEAPVEAPVEAEVVTKAEATVEEKTEAPAKKTTAKKTTTKTTKAATTKTTTTKKTTTRKKKAAEPTVDFYVEFNGVQEQYASIVENVKKVFLAENEGAEITSVTVYLKPQENAAYCVINGENEFRMDVYF